MRRVNWGRMNDLAFDENTTIHATWILLRPVDPFARAAQCDDSLAELTVNLLGSIDYQSGIK